MEFKTMHLSELTPDFSMGLTYHNLKNLIKSIKHFGMVEPLIVDPSGHIICGNGRYLAAKEVGLDSVPCLVADLPEQDARSYAFVANKTADRHLYDNKVVARELQENPVLKTYGFRVATVKKKEEETPHKPFAGIVRKKSIHRCKSFYFTAFLQTTKKLDLSQVKHSPDFYEYVIEQMSDYIRLTFADPTDLCIVYSPKRRTKTGNIAEKIACAVGDSVGARVQLDAFLCHNRDRYKPIIEQAEPIPEQNIIFIDDVLTSGATVRHSLELLSGKNVHVLIGLLNQYRTGVNE